MAKLKKSLDVKQLSLFELIQIQSRHHDPQPGGFDIDKQFREVVSADLKACPFSRYQVAARMSELVSQDITKTMLDSYTAESKELHRFPAIWVPAFCEATGRTGTLKLLGNASRAFVMDGPDALRADIHRDEETIKEIRKKIQKKQAVLEVIEKE